jgi:hypothetical protein
VQWVSSLANTADKEATKISQSGSSGTAGRSSDAEAAKAAKAADDLNKAIENYSSKPTSGSRNTDADAQQAAKEFDDAIADYSNTLGKTGVPYDGSRRF